MAPSSGRTLLSHLPRELTASYHVEGHGNGNLFFLLNTQDSLCSHCLDWKSSYEGETISHTLGVRCLPHEGSPDRFKCVAEEASNVQENKLCLYVAQCGAKGTVFLRSWFKKKHKKTVQDRILEYLLFCKVLRNSRITE